MSLRDFSMESEYPTSIAIPDLSVPCRTDANASGRRHSFQRRVGVTYGQKFEREVWGLELGCTSCMTPNLCVPRLTHCMHIQNNMLRMIPAAPACGGNVTVTTIV
jgi:hypothetical protein